ncbi:MAG: hypothetical protein NT105_06040 [Verrucomicrobia bacterium]|nr:hypothetical protein [Verrucomicrobiota bacterium]
MLQKIHLPAGLRIFGSAKTIFRSDCGCLAQENRLAGRRTDFLLKKSHVLYRHARGGSKNVIFQVAEAAADGKTAFSGSAQPRQVKKCHF